MQNFRFEAVEEAVEEAVVNAVYHRGDDVREPVEVRITPEEFDFDEDRGYFLVRLPVHPQPIAT